MANNVIQFTVKGQGGAETESTFSRVAKGIAAVGVAIGGLAAIKKVGEASIEFERLRLAINTVSTSAANAKANMQLIEDFAATTPFDLNQVTEGFIKLKALGLEASEEAMRSYGNTASAMGKSLNQMVEAVADATTGEFERLKEFGIKARTEGENIKFTFQGVTTQVENNAASINEYLKGIGENQFAGAMEDQANSVVGAVSNMKDNFNKLAVAIGDAGIRPIIRVTALAISNMIEVIISSKDKIASFIESVVRVALIIVQVFRNIGAGIKNLFSMDLKSAINAIIDTLQSVGSIMLDWAVKVIPAVGNILLKGFPIILKGLWEIFKVSFTDIAILMGDIVMLALKSIVLGFKSFGEAINDEINEAFFGGDSADIGDRLKQRFRENFEGMMDEAKMVAGDASHIGDEIVDGIVTTVGQLRDEVGPIVSQSAEDILDAYSTAGSALADLLGLDMELINEQVAAMTTALTAFKDKNTELVEEVEEQQLSLSERLHEYWTLFTDSVNKQWTDFMDKRGSEIQVLANLAVQMGKDVAKSVGKAFASTVTEGKSLMKGLQDIVKQVLNTLIAALVELGVQRIITAIIGQKASSAAAKTAVISDSGRAFAAAYASTAAIPIVGPALAPGAAALAQSASLAGGMAAITAAAIGGIAHGGLENVPKESTYLLDKGERVLSPKQNKDLTSFIREQRDHIENATTRIQSVVPKIIFQVPATKESESTQSLKEKSESEEKSTSSMSLMMRLVREVIDKREKAKEKESQSTILQQSVDTSTLSIQKELTYLLDRQTARITSDSGTTVSDTNRVPGLAQTVDSQVININLEGREFSDLTEEELKELVADKIIAALDALDNEGIRPAFADRELNS